MEIQIVSKKLIKPSILTPPKYIKMSLIDQLAASSHVGCIFYYPIDQNVSDPMAESLKMRNQLEKSLSETLTLFYPLAGRYIKDDLSIECNDEGVSYWEARVMNVELANIVHGAPDPEILSGFVPRDFGAVDMTTTPLLAIQVNVFGCGGVAIGVVSSHKVADAFTFTAFYDAWAKISRGGAIGEVIRPSFELGNLIPARVSQELKTTTPRRKNVVTRRFVFNEEAISFFKAKVGGSKTRLEVVSALIWRALIEVSRAKHGHLRASLLIHPLNLRGKIVLPETCNNAGGNFFMLATARFQPGETKMELLDLAGLVRNSLKNAQASCEKLLLHENDDFFRLITKSFGDPSEGLLNGEVDFCAFSSWCRFPFYEADFGWGKPAWISSYGKPVEVIILMDTKCGKGIEAWVSLDEQDMLRFQQDDDIVAFGS